MKSFERTKSIFFDDNWTEKQWSRPTLDPRIFLKEYLEYATNC